jgi:riboflavin transporter FmnP
MTLPISKNQSYAFIRQEKEFIMKQTNLKQANSTQKATRSTNTTPVSKPTNTRRLVQIAMLSAVAAVLMYFDFPLPFAPSFYKIDLSEIPVIIGSFSMGPLAGVAIEALKIIVRFIIKGSDTAGVGEIANFIMGCAFIVPASLIYKMKKTKIGALVGLIAGTFTMTIIAVFINAYVLLPVYSDAFHMPLDTIVQMGTAINSHVNSLLTFVLIMVAPFNLFKGAVVSLVVFLIYKKISPLLKAKG